MVELWKEQVSCPQLQTFYQVLNDVKQGLNNTRNNHMIEILSIDSCKALAQTTHGENPALYRFATNLYGRFCDWLVMMKHDKTRKSKKL